MGAPPPAGEEVWCQKIVAGKPVKDGVFVAYGVGTDRTIQGYYRDGVQAGEWTTWYENGQRSAVDHYRNGRQDGLHTSWYANGVKALEGSIARASARACGRGGTRPASPAARKPIATIANISRRSESRSETQRGACAGMICGNSLAARG